MVFIDLAAGFFRRNARSEGAAEGGCGGNSAAPERSAGAKRRRVSFAQNGFGFRQTNAPEFDFREFGRRDWPREARKGMETLARRARRGSPRSLTISSFSMS